ncbi:unnamed protein product [Cylindrotheca closterium]|uniref:ATPase AAA-type core domain-containing protein n=1 Tax=Cylindrotheca closterium TaxID=2856 RepID=A0AAD2FUW7_9STRA|nr:unnamed protein product [Cylindrotheca closterium]
MAAPQPVVPIGASVVQFISSGTKPPSDDQISKNVTPPRVPLPCLLIPDESKGFKSMILNGPENSGKTSMAMNLACSCAASSDCPCLDRAACRCLASIVFRPSTERETSFPPACHLFPSTDTTCEVPSLYSQIREKWKSEGDYFHHDILQRIRIVYVDSVVDIITELLSVLKEERDRILCIIIDDLDKIASRSENSTSAILQTVAATIETRNALENIYSAAPSVLITSTALINAPWIEAKVSLRLERSPPVWQREAIHQSAPISHWKATIPSGSWNDTSSSSVDYLFTSRPTGEVRIYWRRV